MGLIGNYNVLSKSPCQFRSGTTVSSDKSNFAKSGSLKNRFYGDQNLGMDKEGAIPVGYNPHYTWAMPQSGGGLGSHTINTANISLTSASLLSGKALVAALDGSISITTATLDKIVSLLANLSASGTLTNAQLVAVAQLISSLSASGTFTDADISAFANLVASLSATGQFTTTDDIALAYMEASIGGATPLSPEGLAESLLDDNDIETGFSMRESLRLILSALVGKLSGAAGTTVTIRDVNDTIDRIVATVDASGNRTAVTKDVS